MSAAPATRLISVLINNRCIGYLIKRGRPGIDQSYAAYMTVTTSHSACSPRSAPPLRR